MKILIAITFSILFIWSTGYNTLRSTKRLVTALKEDEWLLSFAILLAALTSFVIYYLLSIIEFFWVLFM